MGKKKNKKNRCASKRFFIMAICLILILFLALPLIFQDPDEQQEIFNKQLKTLPLKNENPFSRYLRLLKNFYTPGKKTNEQKQFTQVEKPLFAKNADAYYQEELPPTLSAQATAASSLNKENSPANNDYYSQETAPDPFYDLIQEPQEPIVEQKTFDNILIEGLYETSHTDPYEVKQAARKTLFDIFSPRRRLSLLSPNLAPSLFTNNNTYDAPDINESANRNTRSFQLNGQNYDNFGAGNSYNYGSLDTFGTGQVLGDLDIKGLPFDEQLNLVASRLNTVRNNNASRHRPSKYRPNQANNRQHNHHFQPPPDTFDPSKWDTEILSSCNQSETQEEQEPATVKEPDTKIDTCDPFLNEKLKPVDTKMQQEHTYLIVSGRYKGKIMIPAYLSLPHRVLTSMAADNQGIATLNMPKELSGKRLLENTETTRFEFVSALKPQVFEQIMNDEKTILLTVDKADVERFPQKAILIQSGEIETYHGTNNIIKEINDFPSKLEQIKQEEKKKEQEDKTQKAQDLKQQIETNL